MKACMITLYNTRNYQSHVWCLTSYPPLFNPSHNKLSKVWTLESVGWVWLAEWTMVLVTALFILHYQKVMTIRVILSNNIIITFCIIKLFVIFNKINYLLAKYDWHLPCCKQITVNWVATTKVLGITSRDSMKVNKRGCWKY